MTAKEFRDEGFLQEVNRQFFHPLGLALAVYVDDEAMDDCMKVSIWDEREDPEGWFFAEGELSQEKADNVAVLKESKRVRRNAILSHKSVHQIHSSYAPIQQINEVPK